MEREESAALLRSARRGSVEAADALYGRYAGKLLAVVRLRMGPALREQLESRDVLQACLLRSFERLGQLEDSDPGSFVAWFARIVENELRDQVRYHHRQRRDARQVVPLDQAHRELEARVRSVLSRILLDERSARLERALESLPDAYREIIVLRKLEERSFADIGRRLGKSEDACRMLLARAMTALTLAMGRSP